ncbi:hypothetical protein ACKWTF_013633 [Chironomus riparius]
MALNFYKIECGNETKYIKNIYCQLKPISRGIKSLTVFAEQILTINDYILSNFEILHKTSRNNFQKVLLNVSTEYCSTISTLPPFMKVLMSLIEKSSINLSHECPYLPVKEIGVKNFIVNSNLLTLVAFLGIESGEFLVTMNIKDENGDFIFKFKVYFLLEKERYGKKSKLNKS